MKPRILILSTAYLPHIGGSELAIEHITRRLPQYDFDLVTGRLSPGQPLSEQIGRVRVFRAGGRLSRLNLTHPRFLLPFAMAITAWRLTRTHRYILMHAYQVSQAAGAAWLVHLVRPSLPFVVTLQEGKVLDAQPWPIRWARALMLKSADRITAISNYLAQYARRYTHVPVDIIPNGVEVRDEPIVPHPEPTILTVSRLVPKNNIEGIIRAFAIVRETVTNARLVVVGDGPLTDTLKVIREKLKVICEELKVTVDFRGTVPHENLPAVYAEADVFVRPSLSEGLGSVFLEAMVSRVPVVASPVGGIPDIVRHEETGLLCNPHDPSDIARAILRLLTDRSLKERIVAASYEMVRTKYDWDIIAGHMGNVYREIQNI